MTLSLIFDGEIINLPFENNSSNQQSGDKSLSKQKRIINSEKSEKRDERFIENNGKYEAHSDIQVIVDKLTGVHYLRDNNGGITPLLDKNGSVVIKKKRKK